MDQTNLEKLRSKLPFGHLKILSNTTGLSKSYIHRVLYGERKNHKILEAAIALAEKEFEKSKLIEERLKSL